jgi:peptidoglycan/LPS O-acetylase OafA/YrhL
MSTARTDPGIVVLAVVGLAAVSLSFGVAASDRSDYVLSAFQRGPLIAPTIGDVIATALLFGSRRPVTRILTALTALGSVAGILVLRHCGGLDATGLNFFEGGSLAIAVAACLALVPARQER